MKDEGKVWRSSCHCKNIELEFVTKKSPDELWVRKCPCAFCTKQGNHTIADPDGRLLVAVRDSANKTVYHMGHKTSDRIICRVCGVYIGGFMKHDSKSVCVLNANVLEERSVFGDPTPIDVIKQTPEERIDGRLKRWMPFELCENKRSEI